jgi:hypothetical protein
MGGQLSGTANGLLGGVRALPIEHLWADDFAARLCYNGPEKDSDHFVLENLVGVYSQIVFSSWP